MGAFSRVRRAGWIWFAGACAAGCLQNSSGRTAFTVGGTVTGLDGVLILANNGDDLVTITQDGPFAFPRELAGNATYLVTIDDRPIAQNCVVSGSSGNLALADVTDVSIVCTDKSWAHPAGPEDYVSLSDAAFTFNDFVYDAAINAGGDIVIAWAQRDAMGAGRHIYLREETDGVWTGPADNTDHISTGVSAQYPAAAIADNGDAAIVWVGDADVQLSERRDGVWTHPSGPGDVINPVYGTSSNNPTVAMGAGGDTLVAWLQYNAGSPRAFFAHYTDGAWTLPADGNDTFTFPSTTVSGWAVAVNASGDALLVWMENDQSTDCQGNPCNHVYLGEYRDGVWTWPQDSADHISPSYTSFYPGTRPTVALADNGEAIVAWIQPDDSTACSGNRCTRAYRSEYRDGVWHNPALGDGLSLGDTNSYGVSVDMNRDGDTVLAWSQADTTADCGGAPCLRVYLSTYEDGAWTYPADLDDSISPPGENSFFNKHTPARIDRAGQVLAGWVGFDDSTSCFGAACPEVFTASRRGGTWTRPASLSDYVSFPGHGAYDEVVVDAGDGGDALLLWGEDDGTENRLYLSQFH